MLLPDICGIGCRGRCLKGVTSLKVSHRLTRAIGNSSLYQHMEIILFPVLLQNKDDYRNENDIWNTWSDILYFKGLGVGVDWGFK